MSLYIASLNSGSNGNCCNAGNQHDLGLIGAGISSQEIAEFAESFSKV